MTDEERIANLLRENHELREQVKVWKDACLEEVKRNRELSDKFKEEK